MKKMLTISALCAIIILFASCSFFTTSLGTKLQRESVDTLSTESVSDLALLLSDPTYLSDPDAMAALLEAIGNKTPEEIQALSLEQKQSILDISVSQALPISTLAGLAESLTEGGDTADIISDLITNTTPMDTAAIEAILTDEDTLENGDLTSITTATLALVLQVVSNETPDDDAQAAGDVLSSIMSGLSQSPAGSTPEEVVDQMISDGSISEESRSQMIVATQAIQVLSGTSPDGIDRSEDLTDLEIAGFDLGSLLS